MALAVLSVASVAATVAPDVLAWSPTVVSGYRGTPLALAVLAGAIALEVMLTAVSLLRHHDVRWVPDLVVPATLATLFLLAPPPSRLLLLYVATLGLALWMVGEVPGPEPGDPS